MHTALNILQAQYVAFATSLTSIWEACSSFERLRVCIWACRHQRRLKLDSCNRNSAPTPGRLSSSEEPAWAWLLLLSIECLPAASLA